MSVYHQFAENLRALCLRKGTIAKVCEDIGINRQQFNKYLSGVSLPQQETLNRIAAYFHIDPLELFQAHHMLTSAKTRRNTAGNMGAYREALNQLGFQPSQYKDVDIREGCYLIYYPWLFDPTLIVRAVVVIFSHNGMTFFRRFTRLKSLEQLKSRHYAHGHHEGVVLNSANNLCFLAKNNTGIGEVSLQTFQTEMFAAENAMTGISMVMTPWGEYCSLRCTLSYFGPIPRFRDALKLAKMGTMTKEALPEFIWVSVTHPLDSRIPQLRAFDIDDWLKNRDQQAK